MDHWKYAKDLDSLKRHYISVAKQLCYSKDVISKLKEANDEDECSTIMCKARNSGY